MAIVQERFVVDNVDYVRTYSDRGMLIYGGSPVGYYDEACEPASYSRTYVESNIRIEDRDAEPTPDEALDFLFGGES